MRPSLKRSKKLRSGKKLLRLLTFNFPFFRGTVETESFQVRGLINTGEVIVSQRRGAGSIIDPIVRYQFVNAFTGRPIGNSVTVIGVRTASLLFTLPAGTYRLRMTSIGAGAASVEGVILV